MGCTSGLLDITEISWPDATDMRFSLASFVQFNKMYENKTSFFILLIYVRAGACTKNGSWYELLSHFNFYSKTLTIQGIYLRINHAKMVSVKT